MEFTFGKGNFYERSLFYLVQLYNLELSWLTGEVFQLYSGSEALYICLLHQASYLSSVDFFYVLFG